MRPIKLFGVEKLVGITYFSRDFLQKMINRMAFGHFKYGPLVLAFPKEIDAIQTLRKGLKAYKDTGNTEYLVDVANYAMIEFMFPSHPKAHFRATSEKESAGYTRRKKE